MGTKTAKRALVTGGAGFLGSHLCERLLESGHEVLCVDNFFSSSRDNVAHLLANPRFELMRHDVTFPLYVEVDEIFNLACPASPKHYQFDPVQTTKTSVIGAINMLGLAKRLKVKILQASTSEIYGDPDIHPQTEEYWGNVNPIGLRSCYDEAKRCSETLFFDYRRQHNVAIKVVRIFNTYGPRMHPRDGRVVSNFIIQALKGEDITIYGDGSQTRSFCYVDDLVAALLLMMETSPDVTGPINIGNPAEFDDFGTRRTRRRNDRREVEDQVWAAAFGRPTAAPAGYPQSKGRSGLAADDAAAGRPGKDNRIFRWYFVGRREAAVGAKAGPVGSAPQRGWGFAPTVRRRVISESRAALEPRGSRQFDELCAGDFTRTSRRERSSPRRGKPGER